jgi:signal transduction histidine kinase
MDRLGVRLALAIGGSMAVVILVAGILVNVTVGSRLSQFLSDEQHARVEDIAGLEIEVHRATGSLAPGALEQVELRQMALSAGGQVNVYDATGKLVARSTRPGAVAATGRPTIVEPLVDGGETIGRIEFTPSTIPAGFRQAASDAFRRGTDQILFVAGVLALAVGMVVSLVMALRLTRPLSQMGTAAHRLGAGDLTVRVPVPGDREGRELATAFNTMATNLERSEALRRQAASDLAHEIATPVTVLATQLDAMADGVVQASPAQLSAARQTAGEVARLIGDIHDLAAAEGAALHRSPERTDLASLADRAGGSVAALYRQRGVALYLGETRLVPPDDGPVPPQGGPGSVPLDSWQRAAGVDDPREAAGHEGPPGGHADPGAPATAPAAPMASSRTGSGPWLASIDPRQIERALANLLTNASVYTPAGGAVRLTTAREGPRVRIRVADTGPGISPEHQARVFERFYRADPARSRRSGAPGGTGIGLTVARELARANGGDCRIEMTSPAGTTFVVDLPAAT